jgi:hypothetical protein
VGEVTFVKHLLRVSAGCTHKLGSPLAVRA